MRRVRLHGVVQRLREPESPGGNTQRGLILPAFRLEHRLDAIGLLAGLEKEAFRPHAIVQRRDEHAVSLSALHDQERRRETPGGIGAEQVTAAERIPEEELVVLRIEWLVPRRRDPSARHVADHRRDGLDRLAHFRRDVPLDEIAMLLELCDHAARRRLLTPRPHQSGGADLETARRARGGHAPGVEAVDILPREHKKAEPVALELDGRLREGETQSHERPAVAGREHLAGRGQRKNGDRLGASRRGGVAKARRHHRPGAGGAQDRKPIAAGKRIARAVHRRLAGEEAATVPQAGRPSQPRHPFCSSAAASR